MGLYLSTHSDSKCYWWLSHLSPSPIYPRLFPTFARQLKLTGTVDVIDNFRIEECHLLRAHRRHVLELLRDDREVGHLRGLLIYWFNFVLKMELLMYRNALCNVNMFHVFHRKATFHIRWRWFVSLKENILKFPSGVPEKKFTSLCKFFYEFATKMSAPSCDLKDQRSSVPWPHGPLRGNAWGSRSRKGYVGARPANIIFFLISMNWIPRMCSPLIQALS